MLLGAISEQRPNVRKKTMGGESSKGPAEETSKGNPKETNEFVIEGVGTVPLETPPKKLKPFFRKKFRTLFR